MLSPQPVPYKNLDPNKTVYVEQEEYVKGKEGVDIVVDDELNFTNLLEGNKKCKTFDHIIVNTGMNTEDIKYVYTEEDMLKIVVRLLKDGGSLYVLKYYYKNGVRQNIPGEWHFELVQNAIKYGLRLRPDQSFMYQELVDGRQSEVFRRFELIK